jgi:hypothetical protein
MRLFYSFLFINLFVASHAQSYLGVQGGILKSYYGGDNHWQSSLNAAGDFEPSFEVTLRERKNPYLNCTWALSFIQRKLEGSSFHSSHATTSHSEFSANYQSIGFELLPEFNLGKKIDFYFFAGLRVGMIFRPRHTAQGYSTQWIPPDTIDYTYWENETEQKNELICPDIALKTGIGLNVPVSEKIALNLNTQYSVGISRLYAEALTTGVYKLASAIV